MHQLNSVGGVMNMFHPKQMGEARIYSQIQLNSKGGGAATNGTPWMSKKRSLGDLH